MRPVRDVYVVFAMGHGWAAPIIYGVYRTQAQATIARRLANIEDGRTAGTTGSFRVERKRLQPEDEGS